MKVLLICNDFYHPGNVPIEGIAPLKEKGFNFDIITDAGNFKPSDLQNYPVVIIVKSDQVNHEDKTSWKTAEVQKAFTEFVEKGGGLMAIHSGTVKGENTQELDNLIGCRFLFHPPSADITVQPVKPHPVTEGVGMFCEHDEHYHLEILAPDADILIASYSPGHGDESKYEEDPVRNTPQCICPAGFVRTQGKGRVCVLTPGHNVPVWHNKHFQRTLENAINWCAGK